MVENVGALRYDDGKPQLHHIHPILWQSYLDVDSVPKEVKIINKSVDDYFYYDKNRLEETWRQVSDEYFLLMVKVLEFGSEKYDDLNYAKGMAYKRVINSFRRHAKKIRKGLLLDEESNINHIGHFMCNFMFLYLYSKTGVGIDDRTLITWEESGCGGIIDEI